MGRQLPWWVLLATVPVVAVRMGVLALVLLFSLKALQSPGRNVYPLALSGVLAGWLFLSVGVLFIGSANTGENFPFPQSPAVMNIFCMTCQRIL